jgi:nitronate monooxygenase
MPHRVYRYRPSGSGDSALRDPQFTRTVLTRASTGRYARALRNRFIDKHEPEAIFGFPQVAMMTAPIQAAAIQLGDPHGAALWAGTAFNHAKTAPAADIVRELAD